MSASAAARTASPARVLKVDDVGRYRVVRVDVDGHTLNAIADEDAEIADDRARLVLDPANVHIYADSRRVAGTPAGQGGA